MNKGTCFIILIFSYSVCSAQNLVPNGNFEGYSSCPTSQSQLTLASSWLNPNDATPDYLNQCATSILIDVPLNNRGFQHARSGAGYAGIITYVTPPSLANQREYLEVQITSPLIANTSYHFEMYVSRANNCQYATANLDVYFSNGVISGVPNLDPLPYTPQITNQSGYLTDTLNWILVSGTYTAAGGENYLIIGNFLNDATTNVIQADPAATIQYSYYFVDDVSLTPVTPLPVALISFTATAIDHATVSCKWTTAAEFNNDYFIVERSINGYEFEEAGKVNGAGNSTFVVNYSFTDFNPYEGISYYRLKQTDFNGAFTYSQIVPVKKMENTSGMTVYPQFFSDKINIVTINGKENFCFVLYDIASKKLLQEKFTKSVSLNTEQLAKGIYSYEVKNKNGVIKKGKVVK